MARRRQEEGRRREGKRVCCVDPRVWASIVDATPRRAATAVPLDEVVRQDRPGVKITYRGNLSETGSISRRGDREEDEAIRNKNARRVGRGAFGAAKGRERERKKADRQEGGWDNALPISR